MLDPIKPPLPSSLREHAANLRRSSTDAERKLWFRLRAGRLDGLKFRRQHPVPPYIVDFYCASLRLVVELDGSQHMEEVDRTRTAALLRQGCKVQRFWDNDVLTRLDDVLEEILRVAKGATLSTLAPSPPAPLPGGEGS